jgi:Protein of unknown function (DUF3500)
MKIRWFLPALQLLLLLTLVTLLLAQPRPRMLAGRDAIQEPFKGLTVGGEMRRGLFKVRATGVSTAPQREAAKAFLAGLTAEQRAKTLYPVDDLEWQLWDNRHFAPRQGAGFLDMTEAQRGLAVGLLRAGLSARGLAKTQDIMKLNGTLAELTNDWKQYGDQLYWITIMGEPSETKPWGWQLDGHHVILNYFILGDQVVMTPVFMGSEPIRAEAGKFKGTVVLQEEQDKGLAFMQALTPAQQAEARLKSEKGSTNNLLEAYKDNVALEDSGLSASKLNQAQRRKLREVIAEYVGNMDEGHARVRMAEVDQFMNETRFAWIGGEPAADSVFYYRIQSPVIVIEFDHQGPVALSRDRTPTRNHVHTVVRTPNGNDYGKDLLRQHLERQPH